MSEYASQLLAALSMIYPVASRVKTNVQSSNHTQFDIGTAMPLGLILNELISNVYKYAFNEKSNVALAITVETLGDGKHQLIVEDNGIKLPEGFDFAKARSFGLSLVRRLAKQLYGKVEYSGGQGARFVVSFTESIQNKLV